MLNPENNINAWLQQIHKQNVEREQYSYLSLLEIQQLSGHQSDGSLFDTLVSFNGLKIQESFEEELDKGNVEIEDKLTIENFKGDEQTNYGLTLSISLNDTLNFNLGYRAEQFGEATINQLLGHLEQILTMMAKEEVKTIDQLDWLTTEQQQSLLNHSEHIIR